MDDDRELLPSLFPPGREALAAETGALKGRRRDKSPVALKKLPRQVRTVAARRPPASGTWLPPAAVSWCGSAPAPSVSFWRTVAGSTCGFRTGPPGNGSARSGSPTRRSGSPSRSLAGRTPKPQSPEFAKCVIVFTTFPASRFAPEAVLDWYRLRWQVELVFKRFKSVAQRGHLPKRGGEGSRAWLYGKLFAALLAERPIAHASALSPWGYDLQAPRSHPEPVARVQVRAGPGPTNDRAGHAPARGADGLAGHLPRSLGAAAKATPAERAILPRHGVRQGNQKKLTLMGSSTPPKIRPKFCIVLPQATVFQQRITPSRRSQGRPFSKVLQTRLPCDYR